MESRQEIRLSDIAPQVISAIEELKGTYGGFEVHPSLQAEMGKVTSVLKELTDRLDEPWLRTLRP